MGNGNGVYEVLVTVVFRLGTYESVTRVVADSPTDAAKRTARDLSGNGKSLEGIQIRVLNSGA